jgi:putative SOS response-associated peptidase YedK
VLRPVHGQMPIILHPDDYELWLGGDARELEIAKEMLPPYPPTEMVGYP